MKNKLLTIFILGNLYINGTLSEEII